MTGVLVLVAVPLMLLGGLLLDAFTYNDPADDRAEDAPPEVSDTAPEDEPLA